MNYLAYLGLTEEPFRLTPDRDYYYAGKNHKALTEAIRFGLRQGDGFLVILGEVGTGKTMLLRHLMGELAEKFETAFLVSPQLTPRQLLLAILADLRAIEPHQARLSLHGLVLLLNRYLFRLAKVEKKLLIIIDEAQNLPDESIEQLRLLSNFESDKQKWLQIVLVGQPELQEKLARKHLRQLLQRVTIMETLQPLSEKEMAAYVHFRLSRAGRADLLLDRRARKELWSFTGGVPRLVNKLMGRALLVAYARLQDLNYKVIREAAGSLHLRRVAGWSISSHLPGWLVPLAATMLVAISLLFFRIV